MTWVKRGLIFSPSGQYPWMKSHGTSPFAHPLGAGRFRIYFSSRDEKNRAYIGYIEIDIAEPEDTLHISEEPVLKPGPLGYFDDHGVYARGLVEEDGKVLMYSLGWNPGLRPPMFYSSVGLAVSEDGGGTFTKVSSAPLLDRNEVDPWCVLLPFVLREDKGWRMWYGSGLGWKEINGTLQSFYHIKVAESADGLSWERHGKVCIPLAPGESNTAHPCVLHADGFYQMWYSRNAGEAYRIGYAESRDGIEWVRKDNRTGIDVSPDGWDSQMICQPFVFIHEGRRYMLYNGNAYGRDGIGLAVART